MYPISGRKGLTDGRMGEWVASYTNPGANSSKAADRPGISDNKAGTVPKSEGRIASGRKKGKANTLSYDLAAIDAVLSGKIADYNERLKRAQAAFDAGKLNAATSRDDALRKAYIAARQARRVLPQELAGVGAGGGLAVMGGRRIEADYQNKRRAAHKDYDAQHSELLQAFEAEESKVRGLIAKAQAAAKADRIEAMAKAAKG